MNQWFSTKLQRALGDHAAAWDELNDRQFGKHPLLTSSFVNALLSQMGQGNEHLCMLYDDGHLQAMCILQPRNKVLWSSFLPSQAQIGLTLVPQSAMLQGLLQALPGFALQVDLLCNDPLVGGVVANATPPTHHMNHALTMAIRVEGSFEQYWADRSKKLQSNIKRYQQRVDADILTQRTVCINTPDAIPAAIERYAALEGQGWKEKQGTALASDKAQLAVYNDLMLNAAQHGAAYVFELWLDDRLVASRLALMSGSMLVMLKTTYDERSARYAPGRLLLLTTIEFAFAHFKSAVIEFYTDANPDQLAWATGQRWIKHATVYRREWMSSFRVISRAALMSKAKSDTTADATNVVIVVTRSGQLSTSAKALLSQAEAMRGSSLGQTWFQNLEQTVYAADGTLRYYVLEREGQTLAVLAVRGEHSRSGWRIFSLTNFYTTLYEPTLAATVKPKDLVPVLLALKRDFPSLVSLTFTAMDPTAHGYQTLLAALRLAGLPGFEFFCFGNWYLRVPPSWPEYLNARSSTMRNTLKRMGKKFEADGGTIKIATQPDELSWAIAAYERVYATSWKQKEPFPLFMPGLLSACADQGWLRLGVAWLGDQPIAAQAWIVIDRRAEIYKLAYDESFKQYSSGTLLTARMMQYAFEVDGTTEVDYLIGDDAYKKTWMSDRRERWGIVAYYPGSVAGLVGLLREYVGRGIKPWIKKIQARRLSNINT